MSELVSVERVAEWLLAEMARRGGMVEESVAALEVIRLFGGDFSAPDDDHVLVLSARVREALVQLAVRTSARLRWDPIARAWHLGGAPPAPYR